MTGVGHEERFPVQGRTAVVGFESGTLGILASGAFHTVGAAADADDRIIYNSTTCALIYDSNGNAAGGATQFATLSTGLALTHSNFTIV